MTKPVRLSEAAEFDLEAIGDWIAKDSPSRAYTFTLELLKVCTELGYFPERFPRVPRYQSIRKRTYGNYVIFYKVAADQIEIIHIYHGSMDFDAMDLGES